jgi:small subunit ribosomal protein S2e
MITRFKH